MTVKKLPLLIKGLAWIRARPQPMLHCIKWYKAAELDCIRSYSCLLYHVYYGGDVVYLYIKLSGLITSGIVSVCQLPVSWLQRLCQPLIHQSMNRLNIISWLHIKTTMFVFFKWGHQRSCWQRSTARKRKTCKVANTSCSLALFVVQIQHVLWGCLQLTSLFYFLELSPIQPPADWNIIPQGGQCSTHNYNNCFMNLQMYLSVHLYSLCFWLAARKDCSFRGETQNHRGQRTETLWVNTVKLFIMMEALPTLMSNDIYKLWCHSRGWGFEAALL